MKDNRRTRGQKFDRLFYMIAIVFFVVTAIVTFINAIVNGFTNERLVIMLMNAWFSLFTMSMITVRFKRQNEQYFWHDWAIFKRPSTTQYPHHLQNNEDNDDNNPEQDDIKKTG